ncbi:uncharacterized protein Z519_07371 [Cladophialophora bantiana CBS 173.52]|uniref:Uncharacterized protein n=1 Tax=Cladophialophora bantiana (strain ATCC 10958 / CBS 173.52 / CDC B-1940 / NIH 8579) TaxID=1442370 RepID=A0A0D2G0W8_CLAB1|nr:uncharacterized protein Z519_07371 [Cladophialophora bantiana CBS 173.52]KIW92387.1 hypothetical protein Z519_07371 [Cladophialophora bantiana CBS 173.52]
MDSVSSLSIPPLQYLVAYLVPVMFLGVFVSAFVSPHALSVSASFPPPTDQTSLTFFHLFAIRQLCLGLTLLILEACNEWRAVVIVLACIGVNGICDFSLSAASGAGWWSSFKTHGIPTVVAYWTVWKLWQEHW